MSVAVVMVMLQGPTAVQVEGRGMGLGAGVVRQDVHYVHVTGQYARDVTETTVRSRRRMVIQSASILVIVAGDRCMHEVLRNAIGGGVYGPVHC